MRVFVAAVVTCKVPTPTSLMSLSSRSRVSSSLPPAQYYLNSLAIAMLVGLVNSIPVSIVVQPRTPTSTITLSAAYRLQLLPLFDRFGVYTCDTSFSVPIGNGYHTSKPSLQCPHASGESDVVLGYDWTPACRVATCDSGSELADPPPSVVTSLPLDHYWSRNEGKIVPSLNAMVP